MPQRIEIGIPMSSTWHWEMHPGWWALSYEPRCKEGDEVVFKNQNTVLAHAKVVKVLPPGQELHIRKFLPWKGLDDCVGRQSVKNFDSWWIVVYEEIRPDVT